MIPQHLNVSSKKGFQTFLSYTVFHLETGAECRQRISQGGFVPPRRERGGDTAVGARMHGWEGAFKAKGLPAR